jgi:hypothetical protein
MSETQKTLQEQIIARAMQDETFRQQLLSSPKQTLGRELGITLPEGVTVQVYEDTPTLIHLVLPIRPQTGEPQELSDAELEQAAGGARATGPDAGSLCCVGNV